MKSFGIALILFLVSKLAQYFQYMPAWGRAYLDDLLLIPLAMGAGLFAQQRWVRADFTFSGRQVIVTVIIFSVLFEAIIPRWFSGFTADIYDVAAYAAGALYFWIFQNDVAVKEIV